MNPINAIMIFRFFFKLITSGYFLITSSQLADAGKSFLSSPLPNLNLIIFIPTKRSLPIQLQPTTGRLGILEFRCNITVPQTQRNLHPLPGVGAGSQVNDLCCHFFTPVQQVGDGDVFPARQVAQRVVLPSVATGKAVPKPSRPLRNWRFSIFMVPPCLGGRGLSPQMVGQINPPARQRLHPTFIQWFAAYSCTSSPAFSRSLTLFLSISGASTMRSGICLRMSPMSSRSSL